jgi:hypothetical protein
MLYTRHILPLDRPAKLNPNLFSADLIWLVKTPSSLIPEILFKKFSFGILILSNKINTLSIPSYPYFLPQSPIVIPVKGI